MKVIYKLRYNFRQFEFRKKNNFRFINIIQVCNKKKPSHSIGNWK